MAIDDSMLAQLHAAASRFWSHVETGDKESCWPWRLGADSDGYGRIKVSGTYIQSHRVAWMLEHNLQISSRNVVMHDCDNPKCCNPWHLRLGTVKQNVADRVRKGRGAHGRKPNPNIPREPGFVFHDGRLMRTRATEGAENLAEQVRFELT